VAKRHPGVLLRFGGHAMAAGCTLDAEEAFDRCSRQALSQVAREWLDAATLTRRLETDGPLAPEYRRTDLVDTLHREVWGQGFARPPSAKRSRSSRSGWWARSTWRSSSSTRASRWTASGSATPSPLPARVKLAFRLDADEWQGVRRVRFLVEGAEIQD
jgi:single-stranded-DNA-specific exonuclease